MDKANDKRALREALGWYATGVAVVTSVAADGRPLGLTVNSFSSVSLDPPLVLFSLDRGAFSLPEFVAAGHFAINILSEDQRDLSTVFARPLADKWSGLAYDRWQTGSPILRDTLASFECRTEATYDGGDHLIFLGRVMRLDHRKGGRPLLYFRGAYSRIEEIL